MQKKSKKIPSSIAELRRILKKTDEKYLYVFVGTSGHLWFDCANYYPKAAIWAMPLADIAKLKGRKSK